MVAQKPGYLDAFTHEMPNLQTNACESTAKPTPTGGLPRAPQELTVDNPLNELSTLAGWLSSLPPEPQSPAPPRVVPCPDLQPFMSQPPFAPAITSAMSASIPQSSLPTSPGPWPSHGQRNDSSVAGPSNEPNTHTSMSNLGNSQPSAPVQTLPARAQLLHHCQHCDMYFVDSILYTMGCHGCENPFQCNLCGCKCKNKYAVARCFARGQHNHH
ncbi:zinc finger protein Pegasus-like [Echinops telfairi]|uniref:Zinc finger protein Pegasus-like n=1 Tax=Echinops telfairi TaxID=9371 RepID=A0ABM0IVZ6_ECHTE|nr:zinc finger protein Pegasus-like [Echinops telfairi]